jgi:hypothetical protein
MIISSLAALIAATEQGESIRFTLHPEALCQVPHRATQRRVFIICENPAYSDRIKLTNGEIGR